VKLRGRHRNFPYAPSPYKCIASTIINILHRMIKTWMCISPCFFFYGAGAWTQGFAQA
jgi:hypothetical protein